MKLAAAAGPAHRPRGRPRSFDRERALDAAVEVFWRKGYEGASISDLTDAMGIAPPSLYAAFGDKERLFLEAVERYVRGRGESCPYGDEPTARGAVERLLRYTAQELTGGRHPRGCLMAMASVTAANASAALRKALAAKRAEARERLRARIRRGIEEGDVPAATDAGALADFYAAVVNGMAQQARDGASRRSLLATAAHAMAVFPAPPRLHAARRRAAA